MVSRRVKIIKRILQALNGVGPLSQNKGVAVHTPRYMSPKDKRHSGWITPRWPKHPGMKYQEAVMEALEPQDFYDDWEDWRDGQRNYYSDASRFKRHMSRNKFTSPFLKEWELPDHVNKKLEKELRIRRAAKLKRLNTTQ